MITLRESHRPTRLGRLGPIWTMTEMATGKPSAFLAIADQMTPEQLRELVQEQAQDRRYPMHVASTTTKPNGLRISSAWVLPARVAKRRTKLKFPDRLGTLCSTARLKSLNFVQFVRLCHRDARARVCCTFGVLRLGLELGRPGFAVQFRSWVLLGHSRCGIGV